MIRCHFLLTKTSAQTASLQIDWNGHLFISSNDCQHPLFTLSRSSAVSHISKMIFDERVLTVHASLSWPRKYSVRWFVCESRQNCRAMLVDITNVGLTWHGAVAQSVEFAVSGYLALVLNAKLPGQERCKIQLRLPDGFPGPSEAAWSQTITLYCLDRCLQMQHWGNGVNRVGRLQLPETVLGTPPNGLHVGAE